MNLPTFALHPAQQNVFIDQLLRVESSKYNIGGYIILKGGLNKTILHEVVNTAPLFIDAFKMRFDADATGLVGYMQEDYTMFDLAEKDFSTEPDPANAAMAWMQARMNRPFRMITSDCLFEQVLLILSPEEYWLFGRFHHLVMDGYGFTIWVQYMADKYRSVLTSDPVEFSFPSYLEAAALANISSSDPAFVENDNYWKAILKTKPFRLFPIKNNLAVGEVPASAYMYEVAPAERNQLEDIAKLTKAHLHHLTIAALLIYFSKTEPAENFVFGLPVHKRNSLKLRKTIGLFNSFMPFRGHCQNDQTVAELIGSVVSALSVGYRHQEYHISSIARHLQVNPLEENLWEVIVNYLPFNLDLDFGNDTTASIHRLANGYEQIPLQICWNDYGNQQPLELQILFEKVYFNEGEIKLIAHRLLHILLQFRFSQNTKTADISVLPPAESAMIAGFGRNTFSDTILGKTAPFPAYHVQILDSYGQPVPVGVKGSLYFYERLNEQELKTKEPQLVNTGIAAMWGMGGEVLSATKNPPDTTEDQNNAAPVLTVTIAASFVAEPLEEYLLFWSNESGLNLQVAFAPYNQIFQQLLHQDSAFNTGGGVNVLLLRPEDWLRDQSGKPDDEQIKFLKNVQSQLISALADARKLFVKPCLFGVVPWLRITNVSPPLQKTYEEVGQQLSEALAGLPFFYELDLPEAIKLYDVQDIFDATSDEVGHIPFTDECYAAIGTYISRKIRAWRTPAYKVIALDCDNTLWQGICGEAGAMNVKIDGDHQYLQEFIIRKHAEGFLLVLCSKNNEEDVWEVFDKHPGMKLTREHIAAYRIDWQPKPANLQLIAAELQVGVDSFIFMDDNDFEVEQMELSCPDVLAITIPAEPGSMPGFLEHIWAFDVFRATNEDKLRNSMYKAERQRKVEQVKYTDLNDFILTLDVEVKTRKLTENELERAVQLTMRTNQFNLNGIKKSHEEIAALIADKNSINQIIEVKDRFGDYGIVGLVLAKPVNNELIVDTFLLSCRVLGRNVEDTLLTALIEHCTNNRLGAIRGIFQSSGKNKPFIEFLNRTNWIVDPQIGSCRLPINYTG